MKKEAGFTLVETLLVLTLASFIISFPILQLSKVQTETETQLFFEELRSSMTLMQNHAVMNNQTGRMVTMPDSRKIRFLIPEDQNHPSNHTLTLPDSVTQLGGSRTYNFRRTTGNLGNINRLNFETENGNVEVRFQMGRGRFFIEEKQ